MKERDVETTERQSAVFLLPGGQSVGKQNGKIGYYLGNTEKQPQILPSTETSPVGKVIAQPVEQTIPEPIISPESESAPIAQRDITEQVIFEMPLTDEPFKKPEEIPEITDKIPEETDHEIDPDQLDFSNEEIPALDTSWKENQEFPSALNLYLRETTHHPLLTAAQEQELGIKISAKKISLRNLKRILIMLPLDMQTEIQEILSQSKNTSLLQVLDNDISNKSASIKMQEDELQKLIIQDSTENITTRIEELKKEIKEHKAFLTEVAENDFFMEHKIEQFFAIEDDQEQEKAVLDFTRHQLLGLIHAGNEAQTLYVTSNLRLVVSIARRYARSINQLSLLDLIQEGSIGLMKAVERWDFRKGYKFSTFATWWIRQAIRRAIADSGSTIRLPIHIHERLGQLHKRQSDLIQETGKMIPLEDIIIQEVPQEEQGALIQALRAQRVSSLNQPVENGEGPSKELGDFIPDPEDLEEKATDNILGKALRDELRQALDPRESVVLFLRFGLNGTTPQTLEEIGQKYNVTREWIRQIENRALKKLSRSPEIIKRFKEDIVEKKPQSSEIIFPPGLKT